MRHRWFDVCFVVLVGSVCHLFAGAPRLNYANVSRSGSDPGTTGSTMFCSRCYGNFNVKELKRNYRVDFLKDDILRKLRMHAPPNITRRIPDVPEIAGLVSQMRTESNNAMESDDLISPSTLILLAQTAPPERQSHLQSTCYFRFSNDLRSDEVVSAQLGIYLRHRGYGVHVPQRRGASPATWILVYQVIRSNSKFEKRMTRRRRIQLSASTTGRWHFFEVKQLVENWIQNKNENYGIEILATDHSGNPLVVLPTADENLNSFRPYIEIKIRSEPSMRSRRSTDADCTESSSDSRCCRYPLTIDFDAFRWDWVIAPKRYEAFYCSGECNILYKQTNPVTHLTEQRSSLGAPCCAPTSMSSLQMLYIDSSMNIVFGTLPGMVVERCGCS